MEAFYHFIKTFYFLSAFFPFSSKWCLGCGPQWVSTAGTVLGLLPCPSAFWKALRNKVYLWLFFVCLFFCFEALPQAQPHHLSFSHVFPPLESDWLYTPGCQGTVSFLCSSLHPSLCSRCSLYLERNQLNFLLAELHFLSWWFDWVCIVSGLIFYCASLLLCLFCCVVASSHHTALLVFPWTA